MPVPKVIVTGGAGFIGSNFVWLTLKQGYKVAVVDKLSYAGDLQRLREIKGRYRFYQADICDKQAVSAILAEEKPAAIVHFAAESHVDRSIADATSFVRTNVQGTQTLMDCSLKQKLKRFIHISTDEVYGDIEKGKFTESSPLRPNSPYAASKAAADLLVKAYIRTYKFPAIIVRPSNNYGPWQLPEKFIPLAITSALMDKPVPVYAKGLNVREWLFVDDCCRAIITVMERAVLGEIYNLGSSLQMRNIEVARRILRLLKKPKGLIAFVKDRPGHDFRYALDCSKIKRLGFKARMPFSDGIKETVSWYKANIGWAKSKLEDISNEDFLS